MAGLLQDPSVRDASSRVYQDLHSEMMRKVRHPTTSLLKLVKRQSTSPYLHHPECRLLLVC